MDISSFVTSLATSFLIFAVLVTVLTWLSRIPANEVVYFPNRILNGLEPCQGQGRGRRRGPFDWIYEAMRTPEAELVAMSGVDSAVYIVFLGSVLKILVFSGVVLLPVLLPVDLTDDYIERSMGGDQRNGNFTNFDKLSMANITQKSRRMWAHLFAVYWASFVTFYVLWKAYQHVSELRAAALQAGQTRPERFAVLVRDIPSLPPGQTRQEQVDSYFRKLHPQSFHRSLIVTDNKEAKKLWNKLEGYRKKLSHAEAVFAEKPETRPTHRIGILGLFGEKVDTIGFWNQKIKDVARELQTEQKTSMKDKQLSSAIVLFNTWPAAVSASQSTHSQIADEWTVMPAPEPRELIWENLSIPCFKRKIRQNAIYWIVFLIIFFYTIPIAFVSAFTTLQNLRKLLPFLKPIVDQQEVKTVLEAYLPQIALLVFLALLPSVLLILSKAEGLPSESKAVRAASGKYFYFTVLNVFIGVTLGSTLFTSVKEFTKHTDTIVPTLGRALPGSATFFITFVALKFFVGYGLELSRLVPLVVYHLKRKLLCKTEEELREAWAPGDLSYVNRVPNDNLIATVVMCYSVIAPIIIPFGILYFALGWIVLRNQALNVYVPSYESYGRMWPHIHTRILASLFLFQVTMLGFFGVKYFVYAPLAVPLPFVTLVFGYVCYRRFYPGFAYVPLEVTTTDDHFQEPPNMEAVFEAYVPPCLSMEKLEAPEQYEDARSQHSRLPSGTFSNV